MYGVIGILMGDRATNTSRYPDRAGCGPGLYAANPLFVLGSMAYTLIGCTVIGTFMILLFLPALYTVWFCIKPIEKVR